MNIREKIMMERPDLEKHGPITIVAFGDSITHGSLNGEIDYEMVYWNQLRKKINAYRSYVPVNVINAGIGGVSATSSLVRLEKQVLQHEPDLVIVCFGLNDVNKAKEDYLHSMGIIFDKCLAAGAEVIFLTPNMLNTYVSEEGTPERYLEYAAKTAAMQNSGKMDDYIYSAVSLAKEKGVTVCDCYSKWKELSKTQDTTKLLINRINHPNREMHMLFADSLFETIFGIQNENAQQTDDTMYRAPKE